MNKRLLNIAHRGASAWAPENTISAFKLALEMGADGFELDVQLTRDDQAVVIHDGSVNRTTNSVGRVSQMILADLKRLDGGSWFNSKRPGRAKTEYIDEKIPTLAEVLELVKASRCIVYIELKFTRDSREGLEEKVVKLIDEFNLSKHVVIESFVHDAIRQVKKIAPALRTSALFAPGITMRRLSSKDIIKAASDCRADEIALEKTMATNQVVRAVNEAGLPIVIWTVNSNLDLQRGIQQGVKGIITNYPDRLSSIESSNGLN
ncbi:MAG TPA: glycerophosphodiester phosphodiesterase family protein [Blastocatellia bacterium]|nr:glycerophosphodiester phosphodiesterase family protein [Blastocatellia bacterium]